MYFYKFLVFVCVFKMESNKATYNESKDTSYKIATITMNCKIENCELNLVNIGKYLEIDDDIIGVKFSYGNVSFSKGIYLTSLYKKSKYKKSKINQTLFYNQISLIVASQSSNQTNVKLFQNGTLHITGCKSDDDGNYITNLLCQKLKKLQLKTTPIILTLNEYNIALDCNNFIYDQTNNHIIGYYDMNQKIYIIHNNEYIYSTIYKNLISKNEKNKTKKIINYNGIIIGEIKNTNKYESKHNNQKNIKLIMYNLDKSECNHLQNEKLSIIDYKCSALKTDINIDPDFDPLTNPKINVDINCINVTMSLNMKINGQKLYTYLNNNQYICIYNPDVYSGIKFIYKNPIYVNKKSNEGNKITSGICNCNMKCVCSNVTFLIFQTGNVIVSGFKSIKEIDDILAVFKNIFKKYVNNE